MKKLFLFSFLLVLFFTACEKDPSNEVLPKDENPGVNNQYLSLMDPYQADQVILKNMHQRNGNYVERSIYFRAEGVFYGEANLSVCGTAPMMIIEGEGNGSHVGNFNVRLSYCAGLGYPPVGKITAANGDEIEVMMIGQDVDPEKGYYQSYLILEGSGRFSGASGSYTLYGYVDETNGGWVLEGGGTIIY